MSLKMYSQGLNQSHFSTLIRQYNKLVDLVEEQGKEIEELKAK